MAESVAAHSYSVSRENLRGIVAMLLAVSCFGVMDASLKLLSPHYPPLQVVGMRGWASLPLICLWLALRPGRARLLEVRWGLHLLRAGIGILMLAGFTYALRDLPLAEAYAIFFVAPLMITALSVPLLGEKVGLRRWIAVGVGFVGVVLVLRPGGDFLSTGTPIALAGSLTFALTLISTRSLRGASGLTLITTQTLGVGLAGTATLPFVWVTPTLLELSLIGVLGVVALIAHVLVNHSLKLSPAAVVAPYQYTSLVWAMALGWAFWGDIPELPVAFGAALIIGSGLFVFHREQQLAKAAC